MVLGVGEMAMERLEAEITESAAHLAAAECRWLLMIAEFDRRDGAAGWGCPSTAHWLNWRCGLALGAGRERLRVGRRLEELPVITAAFATGELSYSKVRALTRVATAADEARFVELATAMTAEHLERAHQRQPAYPEHSRRHRPRPPSPRPRLPFPELHPPALRGRPSPPVPGKRRGDHPGQFGSTLPISP
jgi:Domain of unknown function (DUF222)